MLQGQEPWGSGVDEPPAPLIMGELRSEVCQLLTTEMDLFVVFGSFEFCRFREHVDNSPLNPVL